MSLPTDRNIIEEWRTGELEEPEPQEEPESEWGIRAGGPTLAESMRRLARAIERRTEELLKPHLGEKP